MDLIAEDIRRFSQCLGEIYAHSTADEFGKQVVDAMGKLVRAAFCRFDELTGLALVALNCERRIRFCTTAAEARLQTHFPRWKRRSRELPLPVQHWLDALAARMNGSDPAAPWEPLVHRAGDRTLSARLLAAPKDDGWTLMLETACESVAAAPLDPRVRALPPRLRKVLDRLLQGDSEKQAAERLKLSRHTVHEYVKMLHSRLEVSTRGELLARFVGRT